MTVDRVRGPPALSPLHRSFSSLSTLSWTIPLSFHSLNCSPFPPFVFEKNQRLTILALSPFVSTSLLIRSLQPGLPAPPIQRMPPLLLPGTPPLLLLPEETTDDDRPLPEGAGWTLTPESRVVEMEVETEVEACTFQIPPPFFLPSSGHL